MGPSRVHACALAASASLAFGCASYGSHLTASPLPPGGRELSLNADALIIDRGLGPQVLPNPELGYRFGVADSVDLGGRANAGGVELNARVRLLHGVVNVAAVPGLGFAFVPVTNSDTGLFNAHGFGSLLADFAVAPRTKLVLGARSAATCAFPPTTFSGEAEGASWIYSLGGVLGTRFPIGAESYLFPELNLLLPYDSKRSEWRFPTIQAGVALQLE